MHNFYLQRGFQIVFIKGDGEFKPLDGMMSKLYEAPKINLSSANKYVPEIERKIWVIKERVCAVVYSLLVIALPPVVLVNAVLFVTKQLNLFPVKGGISTQFSLKQIMTGEAVHYKFCSILFGQYCQISEEGTPRNSLAARTQGAIVIGPSGNVQGGHKFYTLHMASNVIRRDWKALPMLQSVIDRLNAKVQSQPTYPVFTDHHGNAIGEIAVDVGHIETMDPDVKLPGVHLPEVGESAKIPGVYTDQEPKLPEPNVDIGIDFNNPAPQELPLVKVEPIQANDVVCRSTRECTKPVYY